jgi:hypothetical protein
MANTSKENRPRIDEILPDHDFRASYDIRVNAPASMVYERLLTVDFSSLWLVRLLMTLRSGKRFPRGSVSADLRERFRGTGFVILAVAPGEELIIGVAGRFWHRWWAVHGPHCGSLCWFFSLRLRQGCVEFQAAGRFS